MSVIQSIRRGQGPIGRNLKSLIKSMLGFSIPVNSITKPIFRLLYLVHVTCRELWIWLWRFFWNEPLFRSQCEFVGKQLRMEQIPYLSGRGRIVFGCGVRLSGQPQISFGSSENGLPEFIVGDHTFIGHHCGFNIARSIRIGNHCLLASEVLIYDLDGHPIDAEARRRGLPTPEEQIQPVTIGNDVWIGNGATLLKGVQVGDRAIIAARSVVVQNVPADCIVAGNPARIIRRLSDTMQPGDKV